MPPQRKRTSRILEKAELRSAGLKAISPTLHFGDVCNVNNMTQLIEHLRTKIDAHNTGLSVIDSSQAEIEELEKTLDNLCEKMLIRVAFQYGKDSHEYQMAGGVSKSDSIRRSRAIRSKTGAEELSKENAQTA